MFWKIEIARKVAEIQGYLSDEGNKIHPFIVFSFLHPIMNAGQILVFLIGSYASFAIAVMAAAPILA